MIAILGTTTYIHSPLILRLKSGAKLNEQPIRVKRSQTLDAGAVLVNTGFTASDKTLTLPCDMTQVEHATLMGLTANETLFTLSCDAGFYTGSISNVSQGNGLTITFLVCEDSLAVAPAIGSALPGGGAITGDEMSLDFDVVGYTDNEETTTSVYERWESGWTGDRFHLGAGAGLYGNYLNFIWFEAPDVPAQEVVNAYIEFEIDTTMPAPDIEIFGHVGTNPAEPGNSDHDDVFALSEAGTVNRKYWNITTGAYTDNVCRTVDIKPIIDEIVTDAAYTVGDNIMLFMLGRIRDPGAYYYREGQQTGYVRLLLNQDE